MRKVIVFLMLALSLNAMAQDPNFPQQWSASEVSRANTAANAQGMSKMEREIVYLMNLARLDGAKFWSTYLSKHLSGKSGSYVRSLQSDLQTVKNLPMLVPDAGLLQAAKYHSGDMERNNFFDHDSYDGTDCFKRLGRYYKNGNCAENISAGMNSAIGVVAQLLVDDGVPSLGHRKNILNPRYQAVGVSCASHNSYRYCCVQDFGAVVLNKVQGSADNNNNGGNGGKVNNGGNGGKVNNGGNSHGKTIRDNFNDNSHGKTVRDNDRKNDNRPAPSSSIKPKRPSQRDAKLWKFDDDLELWYKEEGGIIYFWDKEDDICLYYDVDSDTLYLYDEDEDEWVDSDDIDFDDDDDDYDY